tara:strand:- start:2248 stop:2805 length:558 start_codon:yes stop_codon:yes gene_type:complete
MSQVSDVSIANQGFSAFRTELNTILGALNTSHIGSSAPASLGAGSIWVDTSGGVTAYKLYFYDGAQSIEMGTINTTANTVDWTDSTVATEVVSDTSPQLGGQLDVNGNALGDGTLELLKFSETGSAVNEFTIANAATGAGPTLSATGTDTNVDINITSKGSGKIVVSGSMNDSLSSTGKTMVLGF